MTAKQYLSKIRVLNDKINRLERQRADLRALMYGTGSPANMSERVQTSGGTDDKWLRLIARIEEKERGRVAMIDELIDMKESVIIQIERLTVPNVTQERNYKAILYAHYIEGVSLEQIAADMHYSYKWVCKLHGYALLEFDRQILKATGSD